MDHVSRFTLGLIACAVYTFIAVVVDVSIMSQKQSNAADPSASPYSFDPCVCVMTTELIKLVVSCIIYTSFQLYKNASPTAVYSTITLADVMWWMLPALLFTFNNALVWFAIGMNDSATYGVLKDTMVLWTALLWKLVFGANLGWQRLLAISMVFSGCIINQISKMSSTGGAASLNWAAGLMLVMTGCNALGTVMNEFALKRRPELDLNVHNMILYTLCGIMAFALVILGRGASSVVAHGLFAGVDHHTVFTVGLQVSAGLFVSRILAYADSVTKSIAASLRGPILIFVAMAFVPTVLTTLTDISIVFVFVGCFLFLIQGPLSNGVPKKEEEKKLLSPEDALEAKANSTLMENNTFTVSTKAILATASLGSTAQTPPSKLP